VLPALLWPVESPVAATPAVPPFRRCGGSTRATHSPVGDDSPHRCSASDGVSAGAVGDPPVRVVPPAPAETGGTAGVAGNGGSTGQSNAGSTGAGSSASGSSCSIVRTSDNDHRVGWLLFATFVRDSDAAPPHSSRASTRQDRAVPSHGFGHRGRLIR